MRADEKDPLFINARRLSNCQEFVRGLVDAETTGDV